MTQSHPDIVPSVNTARKALASTVTSGMTQGGETASDSSERLISFLEENNLHKKDFAEMIGVTLSYVYSLIDRQVAFSTRTTTLERIAVVMKVAPESFPEYRRSEEPRLLDTGIAFLQKKQAALELTNVQFLKRFPRSQRVEMVDMWRGALPLPLDWAHLSAIGGILEVSPAELYPYWKARAQQYLVAGGVDPYSNAPLFDAMFSAAEIVLVKLN